jgi:hypothetical protein
VPLIGLGVVGAALLLDTSAFLIDVLAGLRIVSGVPVDEVGFEYGSSLSQLSNLVLPAAAAVGGLAFIWWFQCAYRNRADRRVTRYKPIWAVVGWLVPGLNLVRPPQIMSELTSRSPLVATWWSLWAVGAGTHLALRLITPSVQRGWVYWQTAAFVANMILLASLAVAFFLVNQAGAASARYRR